MSTVAKDAYSATKDAVNEGVEAVNDGVDAVKKATAKDGSETNKSNAAK